MAVDSREYSALFAGSPFSAGMLSRHLLWRVVRRGVNKADEDDDDDEEEEGGK